MNRRLLDPTGGDGNGAPIPFLSTLPEELRTEPSLATFKDTGALAKSFVEAQKLIGAKRFSLPGEKAGAAEWDTFYNQIGRPDTYDKYETVALKDEKGAVLLSPDPKEADELKKFFHQQGFTGKQAKAMQEYALKHFHEQSSLAKTAAEVKTQESLNGLRQEWGSNFDTKVDVARSVIRKFGGEQSADVLKFLDDSGLGNNAQLVRLFSTIGESVMEDSGRRGGAGIDLPVNSGTRAQTEIANLSMDKDFQAALGDPRNVGHDAAVTRWTNLFRTAHPGQEQ